MEVARMRGNELDRHISLTDIETGTRITTAKGVLLPDPEPQGSAIGRERMYLQAVTKMVKTGGRLRGDNVVPAEIGARGASSAIRVRDLKRNISRGGRTGEIAQDLHVGVERSCHFGSVVGRERYLWDPHLQQLIPLATIRGDAGDWLRLRTGIRVVGVKCAESYCVPDGCVRWERNEAEVAVLKAGGPGVCLGPQFDGVVTRLYRKAVVCGARRIW